MLSTRDEAPANESEVRIRLEGGYEILERAQRRYEHANGLLAKSRFRRALRAEPWVLDELLGEERQVVGAEKNATGLLEHTDSPELRQLLDSLKSQREELQKLLQKRLRAKEPLPLADQVKKLQDKILSEIPGDLQPGERRLTEGSSGNPLGVLIPVALFVFMQLMAGGFAVITKNGVGAPPVILTIIAMGAIAGIISAVRNSGTFTLTSQRLIWRPSIGEPVQVPLASLKPGDIQLTAFGAVKVNALVPFKLSGLAAGPGLAAKLEALRYVRGRTDCRDDHLAQAATFPANEGRLSPMQARTLGYGTAIMRPDFAVFFRYEKTGEAMKQLTGHKLGKYVELEGAMEILRQLPEEVLDQKLREAAKACGVLLERPAAQVQSKEPVWSYLLVGDDRHAFNAKITWRQLAQVEELVAIWRKWSA